MAELEQALAGAVVAAQSQVKAPVSVGGIVATFGVGGRANAALARELHAQMDNPPQYATVLRNVDRWLMGERGGAGQRRTPGPRYREALANIGRQRIDRAVFAEMNDDGFTVIWAGEMLAGSSELDYSEREITVNISAEAARPIADALGKRDLVAAADAFNTAMFEAYGVKDAYITDTERLHVYVGDSRPVVPNGGKRL